MKKNDTRLQLRLSLKEKEKMERNARRCGMSVSGYVRQCCLGREPRTRPPDVFWELLEELYTITALLPMPEQQRLSGLILQLQEAVYMATTKLWHIQGRLKDLVDYVENPEKTVKSGSQGFFNVFSYTQNPDKTADGQFVTAINCQKDIALQQMILTKQRYGKEDGYIAWHGYQSFKPGEVTPEQCHALGVTLARQMWGNRCSPGGNSE